MTHATFRIHVSCTGSGFRVAKPIELYTVCIFQRRSVIGLFPDCVYLLSRYEKQCIVRIDRRRFDRILMVHAGNELILGARSQHFDIAVFVSHIEGVTHDQRRSYYSRLSIVLPMQLTG